MYEITIKEACNGFWRCISPDTYMTTIGTLFGSALGAFLGALGAYLIFIKGKKQDEKQKISLFKKKYLTTRGWTKLAIERIEEFVDSYENTTYLLLTIETYRKVIDKARDQLLTIPEEAIPDEVYNTYFNLCEDLSEASTFMMLYELKFKDEIPYLENVKINSIKETMEKIKLNKLTLEKEINI